MRYLQAPYDSRVVGNTFIDIAQEENILIDPMKLQKLVYIAHGWYLAFYKQPLITDTVRAWAYGPVIPELYHEMKEFGGGAITRYYMELNPETLRMEIPLVSERDHEFLCLVWRAYGKYTGVQLSAMTHRPGTPWAQTRPEGSNLPIENEAIREHYEQLYRERGPATA